MKRSQELRLDAKNKKLFFGSGNCDEVRHLCEAICCRTYDVNISEEEYRSGRYKARPTCRLTGRDCESKDSNCINREFWMYRKADRSCVYLTGDNKCSIYEWRPEACREFHCVDGWVISHACLSTNKESVKARKDILDEHILKIMKDDMKFSPNPLVRPKALFYSKDKKEIHFAIDIANKCGLSTSRREAVTSALDGNMLLELFGLFDGNRDLGSVRKEFNDRFGQVLSREDLYRIVWLFNTEKLIVFTHCALVFGDKQ